MMNSSGNHIRPKMYMGMPKNLLYGLLATDPQLKKLFMLHDVKFAVTYS